MTDSITSETVEAAHDYVPLPIESKWQEAWRERDTFATPDRLDGRTDAYIFVAPPFTSGNIHMGHVRSYTIGDANARFRRARGEAVLFALGFDAFGLPAELGAIEHDQRPSDWIDFCREQMRAQLDELGYSFDWERTFCTSEADVYRWSQWLFLMLLEDELVYRREGPVDWCDSCHTVLARTQVEDGRCWRCDGQVRIVHRAQWYLRLSAHNEENYRRVRELDGWNKTATAAQEAIIGRIEGIEVQAYALDGSTLTAFTPYQDAIADAEFVALSPNYLDLPRWMPEHEDQQEFEDAFVHVRRDSGLESDDPVVVETGLSVQIPGVNRSLPVIVSPHVDARFGATAVLGIPSHDATDRMIVAKITGSGGLMWRLDKRQSVVTAPAVRYRAADFPISRQRAWGTPIPIVYCEQCGVVPVPVEQLPVTLPPDLVAVRDENALASHADFGACSCPGCGGDARRETDTLDCHMDITWIEMPLAVPRADRARAMFEHEELSRWLPVSQFIHGVDTGGFVLTQRMVAKSLRDHGHLDFLSEGEPYGPSLMHEMVKQNGHKMSKHLGNGIEPGVLVERYGADSVRFAILYSASPSKAFNWNEEVVCHCHRFLGDLWDYTDSRLSVSGEGDDLTSIDASDWLRGRLASWCDKAVEKVTSNFESLAMQRATRNVMLLLARIEDFERRVLADKGVLAGEDCVAMSVALGLLLQLLAPISPHMAEELWERGGGKDMLASRPWPVPNVGRAGVSGG